ncbi:hypothetical protein DRW03_12175 [Corallococcus sp. H22C18031201]|uniref:hypothetical protein n=1 Tax=Citreicoccus inhibens TaxID=2849499 RepID=UPI000E763CE1|nr:hypothetical protein [Citreicoccus inhibens]MBU8894223.1 hypothetical protein [Citreicoccus inhibens]RJS23081.1 hypothetical protein DRW03_12175 [Corallococcus sp. H22C18031201]
MAVERTTGSASLVDVLDRVLDRGLRLDPGASWEPTSTARAEEAPCDKARHTTAADVRGPPPLDPVPGA